MRSIALRLRKRTGEKQFFQRLLTFRGRANGAGLWPAIASPPTSCWYLRRWVLEPSVFAVGYCQSARRNGAFAEPAPTGRRSAGIRQSE